MSLPPHPVTMAVMLPSFSHYRAYCTDDGGWRVVVVRASFRYGSSSSLSSCQDLSLQMSAAFAR